jgi:hypothetical protein
MGMIEYVGCFVPVLIGFIFGEILFQSNHHMTTKWHWDARGFLACAEHSVLYTAAMVASMYVFCSVSPLNLAMIGSVFVGHFIVEKFPIAQMWMSYMKMERSPLYAYFARKLGMEAMEDGSWVEHALTFPDPPLNESESHASVYYLLEYMVVNRTLQFVTTFLTFVYLGWAGYM